MIHSSHYRFLFFFLYCPFKWQEAISAIQQKEKFHHNKTQKARARARKKNNIKKKVVKLKWPSR
jgi:hypothetical protein